MITYILCIISFTIGYRLAAYIYMKEFMKIKSIYKSANTILSNEIKRYKES